jgi:hydroxymethylpyrimidine/phosphomethylpyrimidine kinase
VLTGREIRSLADMEEAARAIAALGARYVVVKGGHREGDAIDVIYDGATFERLRSPRIETRNTHGTGCTFAAAIAARLAAGTSALEAIAEAKDYLYQALINSYTVGAGHSPVHHFYALWRPLGVQGAEEVE